jgi:pilus assembly protein CpaC
VEEEVQVVPPPAPVGAGEEIAESPSVEATTEEGGRELVSVGSMPEDAELPDVAAPPPPPAMDLVAAPPTGIVDLPDALTAEDVVRSLEMERGRALVLVAEYRIKRVATGDPDVVDFVILSPREIQLVAKSVGSTNVLVWDSRGMLQASIDVQVGAVQARLVRELQRVLGTTEISVDMAGEAIVLRGTVPSLQASEQAELVARAFFTTADGGENIHDSDSALPVLNLLTVGGDHQVMIEVRIAEMSRDVRRNLGVNFSTSFMSGDNAMRLFSVIDNLTAVDDLFGVDEAMILTERINLFGRIVNGNDFVDFFLEALQQDGLVKLLAEPTLVARSGDTARFLVGGEVPIPVVQQTTGSSSITIQYKKFGVSVEFTPTVLSGNRIHLQVSPEVSEPDFNFGTTIFGTTIPAFITRRASTGIELSDGQSFAIAGLLREDVVSRVDEFPILGDIPILGALFRSTKFRKRQTELVLIVQPRLVKPLGPDPVALPTDFYVEPTDWELYALGRMQSRSSTTVGRDAARGFRVDPDQQGGLIGKFGYRVPVPAPRGEGI